MSLSNLQSLCYSNKDGTLSLSVLDQLLIPHEKKYIDIGSVEDAWVVIRSMQIRGAPLIAIVAVLGLAVDVTTHNKTLYELEALDNDHAEVILEYMDKKLDYLATSRPTAVNLFHALEEVKTVMSKAAVAAISSLTTTSTTARQRVCEAIVQHAEFMLKRDVADNQAIGMYGAKLIQRHMADPEKGARLVTICNTGSLATAGYGTALGVARALNAQQKLHSIVALETRPYNQGSRLTAFEILEDNLPGGMLICDSSAAALMKSHGVDAVVVGADRVCRNGDTANKIGTYSLAVIAAAHGVPFYVASPCTTLDIKLDTGESIVIEERPSKELLETARAPADMPVWNPAFDVTPAKYITGIITEKGIIEPHVDGSFDIAKFVRKHTDRGRETNENDVGHEAATSRLIVPMNYSEQTIESLPTYLAKFAPKAMAALEASAAGDLVAIEMGDGNLNLVFIITNTKNGRKIIVKQALPYVRCVGESWPLTLDRAYFEYTALTEEKDACPQFVPTLYYFSRPHGLMAMEYIAPPNIILRKGLIQGIRYPTMASDMGMFCAKTLFRTSGFALTETELRQKVEFWCANKEMCALTEQVVFTEPYIEAPNNRWTSPQLDADKKAIEQDRELKVAAANWKIKFVTETQALIHADLHSGSVMCSPEPGQTYVIDPEFAFYGPMGFDTGAFIANLFLSYVSQAGHSNGDDYADWVLMQIETFWTTFEKEFIHLWNDASEHTGMKYQRALLGDEQSIELAQRGFLALVLADTLGFAGMKMLRRIVGIAHVEDLDSIKDADVRAKCERHGLAIAKVFIKTAATITSIHSAIEIARSKKP